MDLAKHCIVKPGSKLRLKDRDPDETFGKRGTDKELEKTLERLRRLQHLLYADRRYALLIVLQALDAGGKDGTIRHVMSGVNPQGCQVTAFKVPTPEELAHDFLWRVHKAVPALGNIGIFNRSHYEDVLAVRVHKLVPKDLLHKRYKHINDFEHMLTDHKVTILKFFLHISKDEQKKRLEQRLADPNKRWKVSPADFEERKLWDQYMNAYEVALSKCSAEWAPWYVIPANQKWFRNCAISQIIVEALESLDMKYPKITFDPATIVIK
jgi:PPK2 family polyphosphate:nucleotide phosphotransferase